MCATRQFSAHAAWTVQRMSAQRADVGSVFVVWELQRACMRAGKTRVWGMCVTDCRAWCIVLSVECVWCVCARVRAMGSLTRVRVIV
jgi:hypothetical protein